MKQKSPIKLRILDYITYKGLSKYEFYKTTGITRGILDQENGITETNIIKFINAFPEVNINWIIIGEGNMLKQDISTPILSPRDPINRINQEREGTSMGRTTSIPLIPVEKLSSFLLNSPSKTNTGYQTNFIETAFFDADFYTRVRDLSLFPLYNSGDVIACKIIQPDDFIQWNKIYLLSTSQGTIIKRILQGKDEDHLKMSSDNPSFYSFEISRDEINAIAIVRGGVHLE